MSFSFLLILAPPVEKSDYLPPVELDQLAQAFVKTAMCSCDIMYVFVDM